MQGWLGRANIGIVVVSLAWVGWFGMQREQADAVQQTSIEERKHGLCAEQVSAYEQRMRLALGDWLDAYADTLVDRPDALKALNAQRNIIAQANPPLCALAEHAHLVAVLDEHYTARVARNVSVGADFADVASAVEAIHALAE